MSLSTTGSMLRRHPFLCFGMIPLLMLALLSACHTVPVTGRSALSLVSDEEVNRQSALAFAQLKRQMPQSRSQTHLDQVRRVGQRLSEALFWDLPDADWEFVVFHRPGEVNAFAMAGGKIGVYSGLLDMPVSDDELAFVLGHEIAHVAARHVHERLSQQMLRQTGGVLLSVAASQNTALPPGALLDLYSVGSGIVSLSFSREKEREADHIGMMFMAKAGYDPRAALAFLQRLADMEYRSTSIPEWLSTHPPPGARIAHLETILPRALSSYESVQSPISFR